ncbi:MAG: di-trans,poly-cis-decaprenylcistransferase [Candidatus Peribacteraceae bacterium]|nr:di-trans,poly-cis-decaprenylcistransferase [Candidatus Peribacteraceae bacterium]
MKNDPKLHVAIIPDGNRRWAKARALQPWKGHEQAVENFRGLLEWVETDGRIGTLTLWCFSTENWKRDPGEVEQLMKIFLTQLEGQRATFREKSIRVVHSGRTDRLSDGLKTLLEDVTKETAGNSSYTLHLALDYGGKDEIIRAIQRIPDVKDVTEDSIREHLDHPELPDIDLVIRTSGEQRTSNFALWQSAYAEWMFIDKLFPDFTGNDLSSALDEFEERQRRYGA